MNTNSLHRVARALLIAGVFSAGFLRLGAAEVMPKKAELLSAYVQTSDALASDDFAAAKSAAGILVDKAGNADQPVIAKQAGAVANAVDISAARKAFKPLSVTIESLAVGEKGYTIMTCSMAKADWVQTSAEVKNPYLGQAMQTCGEPKVIDPAPSHKHGDPVHKACDM